MGRNNSTSTLGRKGVDAIFTPTRQRRDYRFLIGLAGVSAGLFLWITVAMSSVQTQLFSVSRIGSYQALVLPSIGLILVIDGIGICLTYARPTSVDPESEQEQNKHVYRQTGISTSGNLRLGLIAFLQGCFVVALYSGLSDEYQSNISMQQWVMSVLPHAEFLFSWEAVISVSAILGLLVVQFLPGKALAE